MMIRLTAEALRADRMARMFKSAPMPAAMRMERIRARGIGTDADSMSTNDIIPPSITNSPWAKFMILVTA
jgi:hypothetical protein